MNCEHGEAILSCFQNVINENKILPLILYILNYLSGIILIYSDNIYME